MSNPNSLPSRRAVALVELLLPTVMLVALLAMPLPGMLREQTAHRSEDCRAHLARIASAKQRWASDQRIAPDHPLPVSLNGSLVAGGYLESGIGCPSGGRYRAGRLSEPPRCSLHGTGAAAL